MRSPLKLALTLLACSLLASLCRPASAYDGNPYYDAGMDAFNKGELTVAIEYFNRVARENPDDVRAHFMRANVLERLGRHPEAVKEFRLVLLLNPPRSLAVKSQREIEYMTLQPPKQAPASFGQRDIENTSTTITNQAADRIRAAQAEEVRLAQRERLFERPRRYDDYRASGRRPPFGRGYSGAQPADSRSRSLALRDAADGLRTSMMTKPSEWSGSYLTPVGTSLYVRNYINFDPRKPELIEPMMATQMRYADLQKKNATTGR